MAGERGYYHVVISTTRGKATFLIKEVETAFKQAAHEIARQKGWLLREVGTMPNHVHLLLEKAPWDDPSRMVGYLNWHTACAARAVPLATRRP